MIKQMKRYLLNDYIYYGTPFVILIVTAIFSYKYTTLQLLINSVYSSIFHMLLFACLCVSVPSFLQLIYYTKRALDLPDDVSIPAAASERYGGAGDGKTSSGVLQAVFGAEQMEAELRIEYAYQLANKERWSKINPKRLMHFKALEESVLFWEAHPEYIPFLASNIDIEYKGKKSYFVTREHLEQQLKLPYCFILLDEAGNTLPQDEHKDRPVDVVLYFRFIRHFGFRATLLEQKKDGMLINVRAVLGGTVVCLGQSNKLLPALLINLIARLKNRLNGERVQDKRLGEVIERIQSISSTIGFRIWYQLYIKTFDFQQFVPPEEIQLVCTNKMPCTYNDRAYSELYLAKDKPLGDSIFNEDYITAESEVGKSLLRLHYQQEETREAKQYEAEVKRKELEVKSLKADESLKKLKDTNLPPK